MKKLILLSVAVSTIYASKYNCQYLYTAYKSHYNNLSLYNYRNAYPNARDLDQRLRDVYQKYCIEQLGQAPDKSSYSIQEPEDQIKFLENQKRTLGVACVQIERKLEISYESEYCAILNTFNSYPITENTQKPIQLTPQPIQRKPIDPAVEYKKAPQLMLSNLQIYGVTNIKAFRDQKETVMVESATGNYALPKSDLMNAERINFTTELTQKMDMFTR